MRTVLIGLFVIILIFWIARHTRPTAVAPSPQLAKEESREAALPREEIRPAPQSKTSPPPIQNPSPTKPKNFSHHYISQRQIEESLRADAYCERDGSYKLDRKFFLNEEDRRQRILRSLGEISFQTKNYDDVLSALLSQQRDTILRSLTECPTEECLFLKGLVLTNQISVKGESRDPDEDLRKGLHILKRLKFINGDNGIYTYFILWPLQKRGEKYSLKLAFKDFLRAPRFENPLIRAYVALAQAGQFNATARIYAEEFLSSIGVPDYSKAASVITELIKDKDFDQELPIWARRRLEDFAEIKAKNLFAPAVLIVELSQLKSLARIFWEKSPLNGPAPEIFGREGFKEFMQLRSELAFEGSHLQLDTRTSSPCLAVWDLKRETQARYAIALGEMIERWETPGP